MRLDELWRLHCSPGDLDWAGQPCPDCILGLSAIFEGQECLYYIFSQHGIGQDAAPLENGLPFPVSYTHLTLPTSIQV